MRCRSLSGWTKGLRVRTSRRRSYGRRSMGMDKGWADRSAASFGLDCSAGVSNWRTRAMLCARAPLANRP